MTTIFRTSIGSIKECSEISAEDLDLLIKELAFRYNITRELNTDLLRILVQLFPNKCHLIAIGDLRDGSIKHMALCYQNYLYDYRGRVNDSLLLSFSNIETTDIKDVHPDIINTEMFDLVYSPDKPSPNTILELTKEIATMMAIKINTGVPI